MFVLQLKADVVLQYISAFFEVVHHILVYRAFLLFQYVPELRKRDVVDGIPAVREEAIHDGLDAVP